MIKVTDAELETILNILKKYFTSTKLLIFGSRITNSIKEFSDLDIALKAEKKLPFKALNRAIEDLEYSNLPFRVDIMDYNSISTEFQKIIDDNNISIDL